MDPAWAGVVALVITSVVAPLLITRQAAKVRAAEKLADYKRQDEIAARLTTKVEAVAITVEEVKVTAEKTHQSTNSKMDKLLAVTEAAAKAQGNLEGRAEKTAEDAAATSTKV